MQASAQTRPRPRTRRGASSSVQTSRPPFAAHSSGAVSCRGGKSIKGTTVCRGKEFSSRKTAGIEKGLFFRRGAAAERWVAVGEAAEAAGEGGGDTRPF